MTGQESDESALHLNPLWSNILNELGECNTLYFHLNSPHYQHIAPTPTPIIGEVDYHAPFELKRHNRIVCVEILSIFCWSKSLCPSPAFTASSLLPLYLPNRLCPYLCFPYRFEVCSCRLFCYSGVTLLCHVCVSKSVRCCCSPDLPSGSHQLPG